MYEYEYVFACVCVSLVFIMYIIQTLEHNTSTNILEKYEFRAVFLPGKDTCHAAYSLFV